MRRYFARRYYRRLEWVGPAETAIGVFLLGLIVVVVAGFAVQGSSSDGELFAVAPANYRQPAPSHAVRAAAKLLPELDASRWQAAGDAEAIAGTDLTEGLDADAPAFADFGVQWVYRRRWQAKDDPAQSLTVLVCDAGTPSQAFGLCRARRPEQWDPLRAGHNGWVSRVARRAAFWTGRYCTELRASPGPFDPVEPLTQAAGEVAATQLDYGEPFWADDALPAEGRVPDTLRYVHRNALGIENLNEVFLVDTAEGLTAWVAQVASPSRATETVAGLEAIGPGTDRVPVPQPADRLLTSVDWKGGRLAAFAAGERVYGIWGRDATAVQAAALAMYERAAPPAGVAPLPAARPAEPDGPFPQPGLDDWRAPQRVDRFTADNLYVKIDGRADAYLQFKVVGLTFGTYHHAADRARAIDVYWYDMSESVNAFGIYQAEAPPEAQAVDIGRQGYQADGAIFFWQGPNYVQVLPTGADAADAAAALDIARRISAQLGDTKDEMWALNVLPENGRVPDSFAFLAQDAFGLDFLDDVFTATYDFEGGRFTLFIHRAESEAAASGLLQRYEQFFGKYGQVLWTSDDPSRRMASGQVAGLVDVVFAKGPYLAGVAGASDEPAARKAATSFFDNLGTP